jgi:hypothetical protein
MVPQSLLVSHGINSGNFRSRKQRYIAREICQYRLSVQGDILKKIKKIMIWKIAMP